MGGFRCCDGNDGADVGDIVCDVCVGDLVIEPNRFVARSSDRDAWLEARARGVTATMVARAATPAGFEQVCAEIREPVEITPNAVMAWGSYREAEIMRRVKDEFGIMPNDWLIAKDADTSSWMMATPDGLSLHPLILKPALNVDNLQIINNHHINRPTLPSVNYESS